MITLFTGKPGNGKTAHCVDLLRAMSGRPLFVMGIPELKLEHEAVPPVSEWTELRPSPEDQTILLPYFTFPQGSLVVIDEAQRVYRPRANASKVPDIVAAFETHRHTGVDFWLITQDAALLDSNIRRLVTRHIHIRITAFGRYRYEWAELGEPENRASRDVARKDRFTLPSKAFSLYKSAEAHTKVKVALPWYFYLFVLAFILLVGSGYYVVNRVSSKLSPEPVPVPGSPAKELLPGTKSSPAPSPPSRLAVGRIAMSEYIDMQRPRFDGLMHTASQYDELIKPVVVPEPVGCYSVAGGRCSCLTQQGTKYETTQAICRQWLKDGLFFKPWKRDPSQLVLAQSAGGGRQAGGNAPGLTPSPAIALGQVGAVPSNTAP